MEPNGARVEELALTDLSEDAIERWRVLARRAVDPNPFYEPEFLIPAHRHLERAPNRLLVVAEGESWRACLPIGRSRWRGVVRTSEAGEPLYGFLTTPLIAPEASDREAARLLSAMAELGDLYPLLMRRLARSGPFFTALRDALGQRTLRSLEQLPYERALLTRAAGGDPISRLAPHHGRELRRMGRRLAEDLGGPLECSDRAGDMAAVERFLELELSGWKGASGTALASNPGHAEFFRELCSRFHGAGRLQLLQLGVGERAAAMKCNLIAGTGAFAFKIAFDEAFARWSPGVQLELENIDRFEASGLEWMDSCADPTNQMINRLWPERRPLTTIMLGDNGARSRAAALSAALVRRLRGGTGLPENRSG